MWCVTWVLSLPHPFRRLGRSESIHSYQRKEHDSTQVPIPSFLGHQSMNWLFIHKVQFLWSVWCDNDILGKAKLYLLGTVHHGDKA